MFILWSLRVICGVKWQIEGIENLPDGPFILVSNHQSAWESFYLQTLRIPSASIIKKDLLYIPFFGWALACMKPIHLRRKYKIRSLKKVLSSGSRKLKNGFSIIIFPEGTRAKPHEGLRKFSNSCGSLSVSNNVPIIPICHNSGLYWQNKRFIKYPGTVIVRIGNEMYGKDPKELTNRAYSWIKESFDEIH
jgi:1-acyl-sn-glycerol-3-phosphate acyltransferase